MVICVGNCHTECVVHGVRADSLAHAFLYSVSERVRRAVGRHALHSSIDRVENTTRNVATTQFDSYHTTAEGLQKEAQGARKAEKRIRHIA